MFQHNLKALNLNHQNLNNMKVNRRWLRAGLITAVLISLAVALVYVNNLVDYNHEVKPFLNVKTPLSARQIQIANNVELSRNGFAACLILLVVIMGVKTTEPQFKGKLKYYGE